MSNIPIREKQRLTSYRKIAIASWRHPRDPSTYSSLDLPLEPVQEFLAAHSPGTPVTLTHFVVKLAGHCLETHDALNHVLRAGKLFKRAQTDIFITTLLRTPRGKDLSGFVLRDVPSLSLAEVADLCRQGTDRLRRNKDLEMLRVQRMVDRVSALLLKPLFLIQEFFAYTMNFSLRWLGIPRDRFGSVMVSNIGALGIDNAFIPLSPYARCPLIIGIGKPRQAPVVRDGSVSVGTCVTITVTFDHRYADGAHGAQLLRRFEKVFRNPKAFRSVFEKP